MDLLNDDVKRINLCFWSFINIYAFCELGHTVTSQFDEFEWELEQSKWYLFESKLQRIYLIFMAVAEQSTSINGYGNIECVRVSLKRVIWHTCAHQRWCNQCNKEMFFFISIPCRQLVQVSLTSWRCVNLIEIRHLRWNWWVHAISCWFCLRLWPNLLLFNLNGK